MTRFAALNGQLISYNSENWIAVSQAVGCRLLGVTTVPEGWYGVLLMPGLRVWVHA